MQLRQKVILISSSIGICERGFSKHNVIKSHLHNKLSLKTLDPLIYVGLFFWFEVDTTDWPTIVNIWRNLPKMEGYF